MNFVYLNVFYVFTQLYGIEINFALTIILSVSTSHEYQQSLLGHFPYTSVFGP